MDTSMIAMYQKSEIAVYLKFLFTPHDIEIGVALDFDDDGWEFSLHLLCWQVWIGR